MSNQESRGASSVAGDLARVLYSEAAIQARVEGARERQRARFEGSRGMLSNADMGPGEVREYCAVDDAGSAWCWGGTDDVPEPLFPERRERKLMNWLANY